MVWRTRRPWVQDSRPVKATYIPSVDAYKVSFPYNEHFVESLKKIVPSSEREYDPLTKEWTIATKYWDEQVYPIMKIIFADKEFIIADKAKVEEFNQGQHMTTQVVSTDVLAEKFFVLLEKAGLSPNREAKTISEVKKAYFKASLFYHPDRNPSGASDMSELNYLWTELKGVYFKEQSNGN